MFLIDIEAYRIGCRFWIENVYGMEYCSRIVKPLRLFSGKQEDDDGITSLFRLVTVFGIYYICRIVQSAIISIFKI